MIEAELREWTMVALLIPLSAGRIIKTDELVTHSQLVKWGSRRQIRRGRRKAQGI